MDYFRENEQQWEKVRLLDVGGLFGEFAKGLCADLRYGMARQLRLAYQPQYHYDGRCVGVEALLRWEHPVHGMLYPPLVIKLAEEGGFLPELEEMVLARSLSERTMVEERFGGEVKLSVNITGTTVVTPRFLQFCRQQNEKEPFRGKHLCIEVTEQAALSLSDENLRVLRALRDMGILLAIDDFAMGQTSLQYLKEDLFDIIKLDGSLVKGLFDGNCREIISSIVRLSATLNLTVLAEFVETEEQREELHEIGCDFYQGYLYSPAVFLTQQEHSRAR
jgi:EAL domain-containing protein (putative c-di-GMP-specific phosphodiesterase class I)